MKTAPWEYATFGAGVFFLELRVLIGRLDSARDIPTVPGETGLYTAGWKTAGLITVNAVAPNGYMMQAERNRATRNKGREADA